MYSDVVVLLYTALKNVSWECTTCGLPNFSSALFETTLFETSNSFEPLTHDTTADRDISFSCPQATSSPKISSVRHNGPPEHVSISNSSVRDTMLSGSDNLTHPSFNRSGEPVIIQRSSKQRDDIPLKVLIINCHSILDKKPELENLIETTQADIILGTESWLRDDHLSTSIFPKGFKVYRKDRRNRTGGGVFILVTEELISSEPEEMKVEGSCELIWAHIQVPGSSQLFIGSFYRPPDENDSGYLDQLQSCLSKIPTGAHTWIGGDFNLGDIDWTTDSVKQYANKPGLCHQLLRISKDNFLDQLVLEPTRITEDTANILDLFFSNNQSLVNRVDIIPGISDHEVVYVESSLRPSRAATPPRKVFCYNKGDFDTLKAELRIVRKEFESMEPTSTTQALWDKFQATVTDLMNKHIPTKTLNGKKIKKPWINRKVKSQMRRRDKLFRRMRKTKNDSDIRKYKECKKALQKSERQAYWTYINDIIKVEDPEVDRPSKQKMFWNYIKSLRKDSTGVSPLKDNGRLFNSPKDKADILNRQYQSVFTHEDPNIPVPDPDGDPYPDMQQITVTDEGVRKLLQKSNPRKASGPDMVPARFLKECSEELSPILTIIFNKSLQTGTVPDQWKKANVSAVLKKGQRYDPANYRPVSLTCLCCKILEHVIVSNVLKHLDHHKILSDCQHGFRARRSCETQLVTLCHDLTSSLDKGIQTDMLVLDFSKAFRPSAAPTSPAEASTFRSPRKPT